MAGLVGERPSSGGSSEFSPPPPPPPMPTLAPTPSPIPQRSQVLRRRSSADMLGGDGDGDGDGSEGGDSKQRGSHSDHGQKAAAAADGGGRGSKHSGGAAGGSGSGGGGGEGGAAAGAAAAGHNGSDRSEVRHLSHAVHAHVRSTVEERTEQTSVRLVNGGAGTGVKPQVSVTHRVYEIMSGSGTPDSLAATPGLGQSPSPSPPEDDVVPRIGPSASVGVHRRSVSAGSERVGSGGMSRRSRGTTASVGGSSSSSNHHHHHHHSQSRHFFASDMPSPRKRARWYAPTPLHDAARDARHLETAWGPIDVDVVRGSAFSEKPSPASSQARNQLVLRVMFFPLFPVFWSEELAFVVYFLLSLQYLVQLSVVAYQIFMVPPAYDGILVESGFTIALMLLVALVYGGANATRFSSESYIADSDSDSEFEDSERPPTQHSASAPASVAGSPEPHMDDTGNSVDEGDGVSMSGSDVSSIDSMGYRPMNPRIRDLTFGNSNGTESESDAESVSSGLPAPMVRMRLWSLGGTEIKRPFTLEALSELIARKVADGVDYQSRYYFLVPYCAIAFASMPAGFRLYAEARKLTAMTQVLDMPAHFLPTWVHVGVLGSTWLSGVTAMTCLTSNLILCATFLYLLARAEAVCHGRYMCGKYFAALTSSRRARVHNLPHFRLHKVSHIKMWLSLRSVLQRRGPRQSVDSVVSVAFVLALVLVCSIMLMQMWAEDAHDKVQPLLYWMMVALCGFTCVFLLRFLTLGYKTNEKFSGSSVLLMEQINLHLRMLRVPEKKPDLAIANGVLKLATKLLKEIDSANSNIGGLSMSPWLYNVTRVILLSAFSAMVSDMLGFKLRFLKFKI